MSHKHLYVGILSGRTGSRVVDSGIFVFEYDQNYETPGSPFSTQTKGELLYGQGENGQLGQWLTTWRAISANAAQNFFGLSGDSSGSIESGAGGEQTAETPSDQEQKQGGETRTITVAEASGVHGGASEVVVVVQTDERGRQGEFNYRNSEPGGMLTSYICSHLNHRHTKSD